MEKVVYLLGAGFSVPLGLPLMGNFLEKSKDMYFSKSDQYSHFKEVFETIRGMAVTKNYYNTDLFNIEEILSILEMQEHLGSDSPERAFLRYIADVISYYTPKIPVRPLPGNWNDHLFGGQPWILYGYFVGSLFGISLSRPSTGGTLVAEHLEQEAEYSVVTLNYDLVLERACDFLKEHYGCEDRIAFTNTDAPKKGHRGVKLAKLHGSIDSGEIVPPTWNKGLGRPGVISSCRIA